MGVEPNKWDLRFLELAQLVASWSKDPSTKTGAVMVRSDRTILSVGFNGFPKQMNDSPALYTDRETKYSRIVHCEMNALILARTPIEGCTLYTWPFASCDRCIVHMIQGGIIRAVFPTLPLELEQRWRAATEKTKTYLTEAGISWTEINYTNDYKKY